MLVQVWKKVNDQSSKSFVYQIISALITEHERNYVFPAGPEDHKLKTGTCAASRWVTDSPVVLSAFSAGPSRVEESGNPSVKSVGFGFALGLSFWLLLVGCLWFQIRLFSRLLACLLLDLNALVFGPYLQLDRTKLYHVQAPSL